MNKYALGYRQLNGIPSRKSVLDEAIDTGLVVETTLDKHPNWTALGLAVGLWILLILMTV